MVNRNNLKGILYALATAVAFSLGGIFTKTIPWSAMTIQATRSFCALIGMVIYMKVTHHPFKFNRTVFLGGLTGALMGLGYVLATKLTTAANAVVLQYTEPIWVLLYLRLFKARKPKRAEVIAILVTLGGMVFFFLGNLSAGNMLGNVIAILAGMAYAGVVLIKSMDNSDLESSLCVSWVLSFLICIWWLPKETEFPAKAWIIIVLFGLVQYCLPYILLSHSLDLISPVTASIVCMVEPILNPIFVMIFYGERIGGMALIGAVIVIGAVTLYSLLPRIGRETAS